MLAIMRDGPDRPEVAALLALADARSESLYPVESRHGLSVAALLAQDARFFVARIRLGYEERGPIADYRPDPLSVFIVKSLGQGPANQRRARMGEGADERGCP
jgi:hypothetical protein